VPGTVGGDIPVAAFALAGAGLIDGSGNTYVDTVGQVAAPCTGPDFGTLEVTVNGLLAVCP
jgi:hypothetical protein